MTEQKPEPVSRTDSVSPKRSTAGRPKILLALGAVLVAMGLILNFYFQAKMDDELTLSDDFEHNFTTIGHASYVNLDYMFPYDPSYNGTGTSTAQSTYTTEMNTTIKGVASSDGYVEFSYIREVVEQPTLLIDVNTGSMPGGVAMLPSMAPGMPVIPFPFQPNEETDSTLYLDAKNWSYRTDVYEANNLTPRTGYARSVFTHDLEQRSYPIFIGSTHNTTTAEFEGVVKVKGIETYHYNYSYSFQIPFPIYTNETTNLTAFLSFTETTSEYHEPLTGALLKLSTTLTYYLTTFGQGPPNTVEIYSEGSEYEISKHDASSFKQGLFWIHNSPAIALGLILIGLILVAAGIVMLVRARR